MKIDDCRQLCGEIYEREPIVGPTSAVETQPNKKKFQFQSKTTKKATGVDRKVLDKKKGSNEIKNWKTFRH